LKALEAAAYRAGAELGGEGAEIVHDYTKKGGVVHKEIMLPDDAPEEFRDRETLWQAVEAREIRRDARLAREIEVALQIEFELQENIALLREYVRENFVENGMCADFAVHDKKDGNPHAHIMLTTRHVTPDGFGGKNREWDKTENLLEWREKWAELNNRKFEEKGLAEHIDHRTLEAQGIDREPTIHLGHEAAALEKKGIRTEKGDYNREIRRRNAERAKKSEHKQEITLSRTESKETSQPKIGATGQLMEESQLEKELRKIREVQKTARYIEKPIEAENDPPYVSLLEKQLKAEKAMQHIEKTREQQSSAEQTAKRMNELKEKYIELETAKNALIAEHNREKLDIPNLEYLAELMDEHAKNIETLQGRVAQLRETRQNMRLLDFKKKKDMDEKIVQATQELARAQDFFKNRFHVDPSQAYEEIKRTQEKIREKKENLNAKQIIVQSIRKKQESLELEYRTQKLLNEIRPDHEQISQLLEQMRQLPQSTREKMLQKRIDHQLNTISDASFQKIIENLPTYQAQTLSNIREKAKEHTQLLKFEREQTFLTQYYQTNDKKEREQPLRADNERRREQTKTHELSYSR